MQIISHEPSTRYRLDVMRGGSESRRGGSTVSRVEVRDLGETEAM